MPSLNFLPTLGEESWTRDSLVIIDRLFSYFLVAEYSQSYIYNGKIASMPWLLYKYKDNINKLESEIESTLTELYERYFIETSVLVTIDSDLNDSKLFIIISITVKDIESKEYTLRKSMDIVDSKIKKVKDKL